MEKKKLDGSNYRINLIAAVFIAVFAVVISIRIVSTLELSNKTMLLGPGFYPLLLSIGMLLLSLYVIIQLLTGRGADVLIENAIDKLAVRKSLSLLVLVVIAVATIPLFGFLVSMFLFSLVQLSFLDPKKQPLMWRLIYSVAIPACIYFLFKLLSISLPTPFWL